MAGNVRLPGGLARRTRFRREWENPTECPPPSEDDILEDCEIALDLILRNVKGVKDLAEKIERQLRMQETPRDPDKESLGYLGYALLKDISTVHRQMMDITINCMLEKVDDTVLRGHRWIRPATPPERERSRSPRSRSRGSQHDDRAMPIPHDEVSSARTTIIPRVGEPSDAGRADHPGQPGDDEDAGEPRVGPTIISAPGPRSREWGHVRLSELAGRGDPVGFQRHIGPSFGLRFYPKHIYECLVTPEYTVREFRQRLETTPRHMLQEMLVAVAFSKFND